MIGRQRVPHKNGVLDRPGHLDALARLGRVSEARAERRYGQAASIGRGNQIRHINVGPGGAAHPFIVAAGTWSTRDDHRLHGSPRAVGSCRQQIIGPARPHRHKLLRAAATAIVLSKPCGPHVHAQIPASTRAGKPASAAVGRGTKQSLQLGSRRHKAQHTLHQLQLRRARFLHQISVIARVDGRLGAQRRGRRGNRSPRE